jgi:hypothetical protein
VLFAGVVAAAESVVQYAADEYRCFASVGALREWVAA